MAAARALPDVKGRVVMDTSGLKRAEVEAKAAGANIGAGLGAASKGAKTAEGDVAALEKRMGAAGISTGKWTTLLGGGAGLSPALLGAGAAAFVLFSAGESILSISDRWETSQKNLAQAANAVGTSHADAQRFVDSFISTNKRYVGSQSDVVDAYGALLRQGLGTKKAQDDLNLALDLSTLKSIPLKDAVLALQNAEAGRGRALIPLGIQMKDYPILQETAAQASAKLTKAQKDVTTAQANLTAAIKAHGPHSAAAKKAADLLKIANDQLAVAHDYAAARAAASAAVHDTLHAKLDGGRKTTSDLKQATNDLGNTWQTFAEKAGPPFLKIFTTALELLGHVIDAIGWVLDRSLDLQNAIGSAFKDPTGGRAPVGGRFAGAYTGRRAEGGPVIPNSIYTVGERGPETLVMGPRGSGGMVIPSGTTVAGRSGGGASGITLVQHIHGNLMTERQTLQWAREGIRRLDRAQS